MPCIRTLAGIWGIPYEDEGGDWGDSSTHQRNPCVCACVQVLPYIRTTLGFSGGSVVKNSPAIQETWVDMGLIPGLERSPGGGMTTHSSILAWEIPLTEEPGGLQSPESQRVRQN